MIKSVKFVSIPVKDQNRALKFYTDKLGFKLVSDNPFDQKQRWIELKIPDAETMVVLFTPDGHEERVGTMVNLAWVSDNVQKTYEEYKKKGVEFISPPQKMPWGMMALFKDSEGNSHCLSQDER